MITEKAIPTKKHLSEYILPYLANSDVPQTTFPVIIPGSDIFKIDEESRKPYVDINKLYEAFELIKKEKAWPDKLAPPENITAFLAVDLIRVMYKDPEIVFREGQYVIVFSPDDHDYDKGQAAGIGTKVLDNYSWITIGVREKS